MKLPPYLSAFLFLLPLLTVPAAAAPTDTAKAADRCEADVADTIRRMRGKDAQELQFNTAKRVLQPATDDETGVRGEGRYRAGASGNPVTFTYSCAFNAKSETTSGVLFRETLAARAAPEKEFQPDLTNISPEACESAAAADLKVKHPRVGRINFGSDSRRIGPGQNGQVQLEGKGAVERAPGMNAIPFSYSCQVEPRSGRIAGVQTID